MTTKVPDWAKLEPAEGIVWTGMPFTYRADGGDGEFWCGTERIGGVLELAVFDYRMVTETRWGFPRQSWLDLAFIDALERPAILSLKKDGLLNLLAWLDDLYRRGIVLCSQRISLELKEKLNVDQEPYYVCEVTATRFVNHDDFVKIREFADSELFEWILTGEVEG